jgi:hypothetical protein
MRSSVKEQVTDSPAPPVGNVTLDQVMRPVVQQMAALAQRMKVAQPVIRRVMVEVSRGEYHPRGAAARCLKQVRPSSAPVTAVTPGAAKFIVPAAIRQAAQDHLVWPTAAFTAAPSPFEAHARA